MVHEIIMPKLEANMEDGIIEWIKKEGDEVKKGEPLFRIETAKGIFEIESEYSGVLLKRLVKNDDVVPITKVIGYIGEKDEKIQ